MMQVKNRLQKLTHKLQELDNKTTKIVLEDITDTESYTTDEDGNKLYANYNQITIYDRYNNIIEQTDFIKDKKPADILDAYYKKYRGAVVDLQFYNLINGVKVADDEY